MKALPQNYNTAETEKRWQQHWETSGTYHWDESASRTDTYVIDTPPPTVSGHLHMGHIFSYAQADFIARWQRMNGKTIFYPMGFDDNGLPTERLVEKATKKRATDFESREAFIEACMKVSDESRQIYRDLFSSVALSVDWRQEYHTISEESRKISQLSFLDLYRKGHVERRLQPMLWDPVDQTAIAQAEVEDKELPSHFCDIRFEVASNPVIGLSGKQVNNPEHPNTRTPEHLIIATTRPELLPACVGVFYHPDDARYQHLKGKFAITPLFGVRVPILEDESVEMEKGTGIMMCCTFGDEKDIEKWRKHKLETKLVLNKYGKMDFTSLQVIRNSGVQVNETENLNTRNPEHPLQGLKTAAARAKIIEMLGESGDLLESKPITHAVKCAERSGAPLEILPSPQWFVKVIDKKAELKAKSAECNWHPQWMAKRMEQWIDGLSWDWCISRQRYFGVPFPVWYSKRAGEEGKVLIAEPDQLPCNPLVDLPKGYSRDEVEADADVMDTWATSSISPQLSSMSSKSFILPESHRDSKAIQLDSPRIGEADSGKTPHESFILNPARHAKLFPADLRPQAHEIIRTWAFYTLAKSHLHADSIPWKNLMISGWCLAEDKQKMSKSKGNVVTPLDLIEEHGADVVRYWASTSRLGQDTAFSRDLLKIGKKLVNKLWNATKFAAIHLEKLEDCAEWKVLCDKAENTAHKPHTTQHITATLDKWILTRLHRATAKATEEFAAYEYAGALRAIEDFFWNDFCDNYLELVKKRVYDEAGEDKAAQMSAVYTIYYCLDGILRLFAPILPHVTEELWSHIFPAKYAVTGSIHTRGSWPNAADYAVDETAEAEGIAVVELLEAVRKAKSERGVSIKWPIAHAVISADLSDSAKADLAGAGNILKISQGSGELKTPSEKFSLSLEFAKESDAA